MSNRTAPRSRRRPNGRSTAEAVSRRARDDQHDTELTDAAAAAERASAGMGTEESEPADWLFGDSLTRTRPGPC